MADLRARALRLLARREHSRAELARKLGPHAESAELLAGVLEDLVRKRQLSDERYAEARAHWLSRKFGAVRIRQDLKSKGISEEVIAQVSIGENDLRKARAILARKYRSPATTREERARRARFLQGRGFAHEVIRHALGLGIIPLTYPHSEDTMPPETGETLWQPTSSAGLNSKTRKRPANT